MSDDEEASFLLHFRSEVDTSPSHRSPDENIDDKRMPNLVFLSGPEIGRVVRLTGDETIIGRRTACDITVLDTQVSRHHARIRATDDGYQLEDLDSTNGTFIEGEQIDKAATLTADDRIGVGLKTVIRFQIDDSLHESFHQGIYDASVRDELTGAYDRGFLRTQLERLNSAVTQGRNRIHLAMLDIDEFKEINDTFGHKAGDRALVRLATLARNLVDSPNMVATRYGGDEFALLFRDWETDRVERELERLRETIAEAKIEVDGQSFQCTITIGFADSDALDGENTHALLYAADRALYQAKREGGNRVQSADSNPDDDQTLQPF